MQDMLKQLGRDWSVTLITTANVTPDGPTWRLAISATGRGYHAYYGSLESVVTRAYAGERGDEYEAAEDRD